MYTYECCCTFHCSRAARHQPIAIRADDWVSRWSRRLMRGFAPAAPTKRRHGHGARAVREDAAAALSALSRACHRSWRSFGPLSERSALLAGRPTRVSVWHAGHRRWVNSPCGVRPAAFSTRCRRMPCVGAHVGRGLGSSAPSVCAQSDPYGERGRGQGAVLVRTTGV
eukprot:359250-Chlamydomonas_euryale.AAC.2